MVQPSPSLLLRPAASVSASIRLLTHPKVPLTPAEQRQLLNVLTNSFRNQLAKEHDAISPSASTQSSQPIPSLPSKPINALRAERHLNDILANPLFKSAEQLSVNGRRRNPLEVFDAACANGSMTYAGARACLIKQKKKLRDLSNADFRTVARKGNAGAKVFKWLLSVGAYENPAWLRDLKYQEAQGDIKKIDIIFEFMVLEGRQKALWDLFEHYVSSKTRDADILFYQLSRALARYVSLESAYESLAKADSILKAHGFSERVRERFLRKTVSSLARATIGMDTTTVPASIFNYFIQKLQNSNLSPVYSYRLQLKHPSGPITAPALEYLQALNTSENAVSDESFANESIWFALDLAQALLKEDKQADARWVMSFLEKHHSKSLGLENQFTAAANKLKQTQQEASNLELLNNLDLGLS